MLLLLILIRSRILIVPNDTRAPGGSCCLCLTTLHFLVIFLLIDLVGLEDLLWGLALVEVACLELGKGRGKNLRGFHVGDQGVQVGEVGRVECRLVVGGEFLIGHYSLGQWGPRLKRDLE